MVNSLAAIIWRFHDEM